MTDTCITKNAMAKALKELMEEKPFSKIVINDICEKCGLHRKSFYYHFRDKYDLVNWIFDSESGIHAKLLSDDIDEWQLVKEICLYLYENRDFYRKVMKITGQNCLAEHLGDLLYLRLKKGSECDTEEVYVRAVCDFYVSAIGRWLLEREIKEPSVFVCQLKILFRKGFR